MVNLEDRVLLDHAEQDEYAERRVEVQSVARRPLRGEREGDGERQAQENRHRVDRALELRGEDHVHEDDREQEGPDELVERALKLAPLAGDGRRVGGGHVHLGGGAAERLDAVGHRVAGRDRGAQGDLALAVEAVDARGRVLAPETDEVVETYQPAARRGDEEAAERARVVAVALGEPEFNVVGFGDRGVVEARHLVVAADHDAKAVGDVLRVDAEGGGAVAVNLDSQLRLVELERGVRVDDAA